MARWSITCTSTIMALAPSRDMGSVHKALDSQIRTRLAMKCCYSYSYSDPSLSLCWSIAIAFPVDTASRSLRLAEYLGPCQEVNTIRIHEHERNSIVATYLTDDLLPWTIVGKLVLPVLVS